MPCCSPSSVPTPRTARASLSLLAALLLTTALPPAAQAAETAQLRVMLHPTAAPRGQLPAERRAKLEAVAGAKLTLAGVTRTGGLDLAVDGNPDPATIAALIGRLRGDRAVLWAEPARPAFSARRAAKAAATAPGHQLLVRLADDAAPDWPTLLPRLAERAGAALAVGRSVGNVWVLELAQTQPASKLAAMAAALQEDAAVQYADPVLRKYARTLPGDPRFGQQWALTDPLAGIDAPAAWNVSQGVVGMAIAVIDTGIRGPSDLAANIVAGYDFISATQRMPATATAATTNPADQGDWTAAGECGAFRRPATPPGTAPTSRAPSPPPPTTARASRASPATSDPAGPRARASAAAPTSDIVDAITGRRAVPSPASRRTPPPPRSST